MTTEGAGARWGSGDSPDMWAYGTEDLRADAVAAADFTGFDVEALDGGVGKVDEATHEAGKGHIVVDTGPFTLKRVVLPAGVIDRVDVDRRKVYVNRTKAEIKNAPEIPFGSWDSESYRRELAEYYGEGGAGWREPAEGS
jgi:hypothetical protein